MAIATFGAGCFWGVEEAFRTTPGVTETAVGYMGGHLENPTYKAVCTDRTGHAEVVQLRFDPSQISYERILDTFWRIHDPTTLNRQGPDIGSQYRSVIFYHDEDQKVAATAAIQRLQASGLFRRPIVTEIVPATTFWRAEEYHQMYVQKHGGASCHI
jgi:peptide-methionine (S)-S-oxide reductase